MDSNFTSLADVNAYVETLKDFVLNYRDVEIMRWESALDNHNPVPRNYGAGYVVKYANDNVDEGYALFHDEQFGNERKLAFAVDNGKTTRLFYLAGWNATGKFFILHPYPNGMDMGPRKLYQVHLKPVTNLR